jgi:predicted nucleic acid-binding protein
VRHADVEYFAIKNHYLDASALVKLVADDADDHPGRELLRRYFDAHTQAFMHTTSYCFVEAISVLKRKLLQKKIDWPTYRTCIQKLLLYRENRLQIDEVDAFQFLGEANLLMTKYEKEKLDFVDCFQILTLRNGRFSIFVGPSSPILITADRALAAAARAEGGTVWECTSEPVPQMPRQNAKAPRAREASHFGQ